MVTASNAFSDGTPAKLRLASYNKAFEACAPGVNNGMSEETCGKPAATAPTLSATLAIVPPTPTRFMIAALDKNLNWNPPKEAAIITIIKTIHRIITTVPARIISSRRVNAR